MFELDESDRSLDFVYNNELTEKHPIKDQSLVKTLKMHFSVPPYDIFTRVFSSLLPPILTRKYQKIYVDLFGPLLALIILTGLLNFGYNMKLSNENIQISPSELLLGYIIIMPSFCYLLIKLAQSEITFIELSSLLGYSLYGHIFTLVISYFFDDENSYFFFICLMVLGGMSTLRVAMIFIVTIPKPALRLVTCSFVAIVQLLFLVFIQFAYMHKTFVYGSG